MAGIEKPILLDLPVPIRTKRLTLHPLQTGDGAAMFTAISESMAEFAPWLEWASSPQTPETAEETARRFSAEFLLRKHLSFAIFSDARFLGMVALYGFKWNIPSACCGYWLRTSETGKGYMTESVNALSLYGFRHIGLRRLAILCDADNLKSIAVPKRLDFALEATSPMADIHPQTGEPTTELVFVRLNDAGLDDASVSWPA